ncbi:MAG: hypothetical protein WCT03_18855 [Candidatus Obscuribacterales bacterium]|jgi:hypothetical protein
MAPIALLCLASPTQAEDSKETLNRKNSNWEIAKANVDRFLGLDPKALAALFKREPAWHECNIEMDDSMVLRFYRGKIVDEFAFVPPDSHSMPGYRGRDERLEYPPAKSNTIWTGVKRKDEKEYWTLIKANLETFVGMSSEEIIALLGPERCSNQPRNTITYRIGDSCLDFYLKNSKVEKFKFRAAVYIPGT